MDHDVEIDKYAGLESFLGGRVLGQPVAVSTLSRAVRAGEMGHTPKGMPKCFALVLGPTGTGKTKAVLEMSKYLFGTDQVARINMAEFGSAEGLSQFIPTLCDQLDQLLASKGKFLLLDEIEKGHPKASDIFLGMEAAMIQNPVSGKRYDLSDLHIFVTSNVGANDLSEIDEGVPFPTLKRVVEDAAKSQFRPEVFARFSHVVIYRKLPRDAQVKICQQMLDEELTYQSGVLSKMFGHPHTLVVGPGVFRRLISEGYHRELGARPMRNVVSLRVRDALTLGRISKAIGPGVACTRLDLEGDALVARPIGRCV